MKKDWRYAAAAMRASQPMMTGRPELDAVAQATWDMCVDALCEAFRLAYRWDNEDCAKFVRLCREEP